jgi:4a-hydroxytetrahydrobiopterin dehydratase
MDVKSAGELQRGVCQPCEGGLEPCGLSLARQQLDQLPGWKLTDKGDRIRRDWKFSDFGQAMQFLVGVAMLAEREQHHPDLHLEGYRQVGIELTTHAIGGLSENDFIVAAKIDALDRSPGS